MKCPRCHAQTDPRSRFCEECGGRVELTCPGCGQPVGVGKKFCRTCGVQLATEPGPVTSPAVYTPKHLAERILTSRSALEGERKQVTVLFADLKGSLELLADRDPEEARKILDPVLERMMEAVHRYEGTVNQVMGDGIMALFGAPVAHENHAVRACYAALRMQETISRYGDELQRSHGVPVQIRVGLNSGEVVVRSIGSDLHMDYTAVGQTTHLAARLEQMAKPGSALMTAHTLQLAEGYVHVDPLGPVPIKGLAAPLEVFQLTGAGHARSRLQAAAARGLSRFVGRAAELGRLEGALEQARSGHGQIVAVAGEPGIGKSRLFYEFTRSHPARGCLVLETTSVSHGKATAYLAVLDMLKRYLRVEDRDDTRTVREKVVGKILTLDPPLEDAVPAVLGLLDALPEDHPFLALDPPRRRQRTLEAVTRLLLRESQVQPVVAVFEDLHWIDADTQAFLDRLTESLPASRLLLVVNYRPEYRHGWGAKPYCTEITIDPLPDESSEELLRALLGSGPDLQPLKRLLVERTEGNPFFLEECVRTLVETGALQGAAGAYRLAQDVGHVQVPPTVRAVLAARIDRLPPGSKRVLQAASAIGKEVPLALLQPVADLSEEELGQVLKRLQTGEFLDEARLYPEIEYSFKHALTLDVAFGSLVRERRRELDARIVEAIERLDPDRSARQVERLAHHSFRGEVWDKALRYCSEAGARAFARSAHEEALHHVDRALEALAQLADASERKTLELELVTQRAAALRALRGYAAPEVEKVYLRARELCRDVGDTPDRFRVEWQQMQFFLVRGDLGTASELAGSLLESAERRQDRGLLIDAHLASGMTRFHLADFAAARDHLERGVALYRPEADRPNFFTHGQDPGVFCLAYLAWALWFLGYPDQARARAETAVGIAQQKAHAFSHVSALTFAARVHQCRRDLQKVRRLAEEIVSLSRDRGFAYYEALGHIQRGWAMVLMEGDEAGCAQLFDGYTALEGTGTVLGLRGALVQLAEACQRLGRVDRALWALDRAETHEQGRGTQCWEAELARLRAEPGGRGRGPLASGGAGDGAPPGGQVAGASGGLEPREGAQCSRSPRRGLRAAGRGRRRLHGGRRDCRAPRGANVPERERRMTWVL